jgi:hypothetical protein
MGGEVEGPEVSFFLHLGMKFINFFLLLWVIFALMDPDLS